jgi:8-oxo-dGTP pyrophosphatase MutT (NUDIX family)
LSSRSESVERELLARIEARIARDPRAVALRSDELVRVFGDRARGIAPESLRPSAVLVPIVLRAGGATLLLTRRASGVPVRGGDIVFPGGGARGAESLAETALREAQEETGVPATRARVLGFLERHPTLIGFWIQPVVALVPGDFIAQPNPREVDAVYELPLAQALDLSRHRRVRVSFDGGEHEVQNFEHAGIALWGVSAAITRDLAELARA